MNMEFQEVNDAQLLFAIKEMVRFGKSMPLSSQEYEQLTGNLEDHNSHRSGWADDNELGFFKDYIRRFYFRGANIEITYFSVMANVEENWKGFTQLNVVSRDPDRKHFSKDFIEMVSSGFFTEPELDEVKVLNTDLGPDKPLAFVAFLVDRNSL